MKRTFALALLALAACTPAPLSEPAATVEKIYQPLIDSKGDKTTDLATIPMTTELALLIQEVESTADGVVFDGDFAGNCQDCTGFSNLKVSDDTETKLAIGEGHKLIRADFKLLEETRSVLWDMVQQDGVWKVDNILTNDFNIRGVAEEAVAGQATDRKAAGEAAITCMAFLRLEADQLELKKTSGNSAQIEAAFEAWKVRATAEFAEDDLMQRLSSSLDVLQNTPFAEIKTKSDACIASAPAATPQ